MGGRQLWTGRGPSPIIHRDGVTLEGMLREGKGTQEALSRPLLSTGDSGLGAARVLHTEPRAGKSGVARFKPVSSDSTGLGMSE